MILLENHLLRLLSCFNGAIYHEVNNIQSLLKIYPSIGEIHPAECREQHIQSLFFLGLRSAGYYVHSETQYFYPKSNSRRLDLACWLPEIKKWLFIELEHCSPLSGFKHVLNDAMKFKDDTQKGTLKELKCLLVYGFRDVVTRDTFPEKYEKLSNALVQKCFSKIEISRTPLFGKNYKYLQTGLWAYRH